MNTRPQVMDESFFNESLVDSLKLLKVTKSNYFYIVVLWTIVDYVTD